MKQLLIILLILVSVSSCKIYHTQREPQIQSFLAITSQGDTIQVSSEYLRTEFNQNPYNYSNWRFYWDNNWYYGNGWFNYYDPYWIYRIPYQNRIIIQPRPRVSTPRYVPRHFDNRPNPPIRREPQVQPNRGRTNVQPRVQQQPPSRIQQQPRTPQRTQPQRQVPPTRNGNSTPRPQTRGGVDIKQ